MTAIPGNTKNDPTTGCCACRGDTKRAAVDPAYRRALWIVVVLNVGFGIIELVGGISVVALLVNLSAALVLIPFRNQGDANARAIWLFSRNDALANIAVLFAASLVAWLQAAWPDLVVAGIIAVLFLHSAQLIVRDAHKELHSDAGKAQ